MVFFGFDDQYPDGIFVATVVIGEAIKAAVVFSGVPSSGSDVRCAGFASDLQPLVLPRFSGTALDHFHQNIVYLFGCLGADGFPVRLRGRELVVFAVSVLEVVDDARRHRFSVIVESGVGFEHLGECGMHAVAVCLIGAVHFVVEKPERFDLSGKITREIDTRGLGEAKFEQPLTKLLA